VFEEYHQHQLEHQHTESSFNETKSYFIVKIITPQDEHVRRLEKQLLQEDIDLLAEVIWTLINCSFVMGRMIGTFGSKFLLDRLGRKRSLVCNQIVGIAGAVFILIAYCFNSPVQILLSRFLYGIQGGVFFVVEN
jgi:MFS family permease